MFWIKSNDLTFCTIKKLSLIIIELFGFGSYYWERAFCKTSFYSNLYIVTRIINVQCALHEQCSKFQIIWHLNNVYDVLKINHLRHTFAARGSATFSRLVVRPSVRPSVRTFVRTYVSNPCPAHNLVIWSRILELFHILKGRVTRKI